MTGVNKKITAVLLVKDRLLPGGSITTQKPTVLWPVVPGKSALENTVAALISAGVEDILLFTNYSEKIAEFVLRSPMGKTVKVIDEAMPLGPAGCLGRAAELDGCGDIYVVLNPSIVRAPDIGGLLDRHIESGALMTVVFELGFQQTGNPSNIFICSKGVLDFLPDEGYCDIKEQLVGDILANGQRVAYDELESPIGTFVDSESYKVSMSLCIWDGQGHYDGALEGKTVPENMKIRGPVVLGSGVKIEDGAVICGPAFIGNNVIIGSETVLNNCFVWDDAVVGGKCIANRCLVGEGCRLKDGCKLEDGVIFKKAEGIILRMREKAKEPFRDIFSIQGNFEYKNFYRIFGGITWRESLALFGLILVGFTFMWSYVPQLVDLFDIWHRSDEYSSGMLVPFLACYALWVRRKTFSGIIIKPCLWAIVIIAGAQVLRFFGLYYMFASAERLSLVLCLGGSIFMICGWPFFKRFLPIQFYLFLMLPWPTRVQAGIAGPLQGWATSSAVYLLEVFGWEVVREGNLIHIGSTTVAVAEACNGLRMITAFFIIIGLIVLIARRSWFENVIIIISCLPIALVCNTIRLVLTSAALTIFQGHFWEQTFHDFGGYAMMPLAIVLAIIEFWVLSELFPTVRSN
jgi:exosortase